ncbi:pseudouridine synthase [[Clostridium] aminophilum]|uniref:Pseudouridine synthase n=1 Tax=[Clostridium] aminophilum TaxID=1526 RepID=A0A1I6IIT5_9FIRM|nr:pseudouridine synthase [[Clostridium] aminophilum]SFR66645.1 16S rRNA pseudouridine516 synthase [[Clostridium] aminophilum]
MRIDRYLSEMGAGTRSELKKMIRKGQVSVDGEMVRDPGYSVEPGQKVLCAGVPIEYETKVYYLMNKPAGVITATEDRHQKTVLDLIGERTRKDLFPVGRLDRDTTGLLLITNDGELGHRLLSPKKHVDKRYRALVRGEVTGEDVRKFAEGLHVDEELTALPAALEILEIRSEGEEKRSVVEVVIREGKFHQIKRMFGAVGKEVLELKRLTMGPLRLDPDLEEGQWRRLTEKEQKELREITGMG